jgi:large subunit ribosomal protein L17
VRALVLKEKIETTETKAKSLRPQVERLITKAKTDSVASRRLLASRLGGQPDTVKKLFETIGPRYRERSGGYTRITKLPNRASDNAPMAVIEFV